MTETVNSFNKLGTAIEGIIKKQVKDFALAVWDEVVMTPVHPVDTGTLRYSWKMVPYIGGDKGSAGDTYSVKKGTESNQYGMPTRPDLSQYQKRWSNYLLFNNQPYVDRVNGLPNKPYTDWIQTGVDIAASKFR